MKREDISEAVSNISTKYIQEAAPGKRANKKPAWMKWGAMVACLCLLCIGVYVLQNPSQSPTPQGSIPSAQEDKFVAISSLLAESSSNLESEITTTVPISQYTGVYEKVASVDSEVLSRSIGTTISENKTWYYVSGHTDLQYLIQNNSDMYSLWKFKCFDSKQYPYSDVLKIVYQIDSTDKISEIKVNPATMDNTDSGKVIQAEIGIHIVTNSAEIETMYNILASLTCYGENQWDRIDYGNVEAASDKETFSNKAIQLGRYLTFVTSYGNEIDGLKYTAVSNMFYEFSGIAYNQLTEEDDASICKILHIERTKENAQISSSDNKNAPSVPAEEASTAPTGKNTSITLKYITELQTKVSAAMSNGELPFVSSSAVYENPYRLHVVVSSNAENDLAKLEAFDTIGGALEIEYSKKPMSLEDMAVEIKSE